MGKDAPQIRILLIKPGNTFSKTFNGFRSHPDRPAGRKLIPHKIKPLEILPIKVLSGCLSSFSNSRMPHSPAAQPGEKVKIRTQMNADKRR
ncbi:MAG: hypothetical protein GY749_34660 [Desulfobacteraceae bacterium]|nr:hypothetical protein [Desulfobacteraceae bacterium]